MKLILIITSGQSNKTLAVWRIQPIVTANTASTCTSPARTQAEVSIRRAEVLTVALYIKSCKCRREATGHLMSAVHS
jgi:hypothetical protein